MLTYVLTAERGVPSFAPEHSDVLLNATFMEQIIGTLVKYGNSGRFEPFLAAEWSSSHDRKVWRFKLRQGLTCEDGTPITASTYLESLKKILRIYAVESIQVPVFEKIVGFQEFLKDSKLDLVGAKQVSNLGVEFEFLEPPSGLLEYLSMPYYGFYCPRDFEVGRWRDPRRITSSGAYSLLPWDGKSDIVLKKRSEWFSHVPSSPESVTIKMLPFEEARKLPPNRTIIARKVQSSSEIPEGYTKVLGTPTDLISIVLSPNRKAVFHIPGNRKEFRSILRQVQQSIPFTPETSQKTVTFYRATSEVPIGVVGPIPPSEKSSPVAPVMSKAIRVVLSNALTAAEREYTEVLIRSGLERWKLVPVFEAEDRSRADWKRKLEELLDHDIRVARVDIGGSAESWVIRMMFCSRMGVSFPDPSGRICSLTDEFEHSPLNSNGISKEEYSDRFERIVAEDGTVIPVFHSSFSWLYSNDIDMSSISPSANLPRFDLVVLK